MAEVKRNYKDTVFRMIFRDKTNLLSLYNAVNGTENYPARKTVYLSEAYEKKEDTPALELAVTVINLNHGNSELLES